MHAEENFIFTDPVRIIIHSELRNNNYFSPKNLTVWSAVFAFSWEFRLGTVGILASFSWSDIALIEKFIHYFLSL